MGGFGELVRDGGRGGTKGSELRRSGQDDVQKSFGESKKIWWR